MGKLTNILDLNNQDLTLRILRSKDRRKAGKVVAAIIDKTRDDIRGIVNRGGGNEDDAQDLIQETAITFFNYFSRKVQDPPRASLTAFFKLIARNKWIDHLRGKDNRLTYESVDQISESDLIEFVESDPIFSSQGELHLSESITITQLIEVIHTLKDKEQRNDFIERALANESTTNDIKTLIDQIVSLSYEAGRQSMVVKATSAARSQLINNSDSQAQQLAPIISEIKQKGASTLKEIADALNDANIPTKNGHRWYASTVKQVIDRIGTLHGTHTVSSPVDDFTKRMIPIIEELKQGGIQSPSAISRALNDQDITTKSGQKWYPNTVQVLLKRIDELHHPDLNKSFKR